MAFDQQIEQSPTPDLFPSDAVTVPEPWKLAALSKAKCEGGDWNQTRDRKNPAFSRIATVKDRRRQSRIVPDRHNLGDANELSPIARTISSLGAKLTAFVRHRPRAGR
jgi:hypothetical protein